MQSLFDDRTSIKIWADDALKLFCLNWPCHGIEHLIREHSLTYSCFACVELVRDRSAEQWYFPYKVSECSLIKKMGQSRPPFRLFSSFSCYNSNNTNWKSIDGVLGIRTQGRRMVGADETTELWWPPYNLPFMYEIKSHYQSSLATTPPVGISCD